MFLCNILYSALVGSSSVKLKPLSLKLKRHNFLRKRETPSIPLVSQGFDSVKGPRNISYKRSESPPNFSQSSSGLTTLCQRFDIFPTSLVAINCPSSNM